MDFHEEAFVLSARAHGDTGAVVDLLTEFDDLLEAMVWDLTRAAGTDSFPDDVSGIVLDLLPQEPGQHRPVPGIAKPGQRLFDW